MRKTFLLLIVTLLGNGSTISATTTGNQAAISTLESPVLLTHDTQKRFLRSHSEAEEGSEEDEFGNAEERKVGANLFADSKLAQMLNSRKTFPRFARWKREGFIPSTLRTKLEKLGLWTKYSGLHTMYSNNYYVHHREGQTVKVRVDLAIIHSRRNTNGGS
ncbi:secreted RxLR effector peptide protein, putative [Phytophthora infestans T30-4]|uniref:RxLR effector protein n=2 Tax=Phytophthora infestans TaxID=4787 RepID=D0N4I9_PHYIT|nr:secreted RxLR effector peptide protein, putative [Phytophthora infestans T30-4]EEY69797.1 secreted RxLR effector peptide protein, putative [Phytophthora infestans T30-4]KAF4142048.1 RXLR effector domain-containing protein [Phytophthora infestans]|eukprot:XP_002998444.1 secreted RxLR effector peptide protein, putative [Phytophthora infestans T30-4]